jgi:uncharacterized protein YciI
MPLAASFPSSAVLRRAAAALAVASALMTGAATAAEPSAAAKTDKPAAAEAPKADKPAPAASSTAAPKREFEKYVLVILRRGPAWSPERTPESDKLQVAHLGHLRAMAEAGKMVVAGPFGDQEDETARGLCLYRGVTVAEARELAGRDPAVKAGRLKVEAMTWYTEKGAMTFPLAESYAASKR